MFNLDANRKNELFRSKYFYYEKKWRGSVAGAIVSDFGNNNAIILCWSMQKLIQTLDTDAESLEDEGPGPKVLKKDF